MRSTSLHTQLARGSHERQEPNKRSALLYVGLLLLADRELAEGLLRGDPIDETLGDLGESVPLNDRDRATLSDIREQVATVNDLLAYVAEVANDALPIS